MSHKNAEVPSAAAASGDGGDLGDFLLKRLALQNQELEVDKLFRAVGQARRERFAPESRQPADGSHEGRAASSQSRPD